jgi:hypothetical protein
MQKHVWYRLMDIKGWISWSLHEVWWHLWHAMIMERAQTVRAILHRQCESGALTIRQFRRRTRCTVWNRYYIDVLLFTTYHTTLSQ